MRGFKIGKRIKLKPIHVMLMILSMSFLILAYCMYEMDVFENYNNGWVTLVQNRISANRNDINRVVGISNTNKTGIDTNKTGIDTNKTGIDTNTTNIATNTTGIATNTTGIDTNKTGIDTINTKLLENNYVTKTILDTRLSDIASNLDAKISKNNVLLKTDIINMVDNKIDIPLTELAKIRSALNQQESS